MNSLAPVTIFSTVTSIKYYIPNSILTFRESRSETSSSHGFAPQMNVVNVKYNEYFILWQGTFQEDNIFSVNFAVLLYVLWLHRRAKVRQKRNEWRKLAQLVYNRQKCCYYISPLFISYLSLLRTSSRKGKLNISLSFTFRPFFKPGNIFRSFNDVTSFTAILESNRFLRFTSWTALQLKQLYMTEKYWTSNW